MVQFEVIGNNNYTTTLGNDPDTYSHGHFVHCSLRCIGCAQAQEISKEIVERAAERELRKQKYAQYQKIKQTSDYKVPRADPIPVPDLTKPKQKKEGWPPSALCTMTFLGFLIPCPIVVHELFVSDICVMFGDLL